MLFALFLFTLAISIFVILLSFYLKLDCDITLYCAEQYGHKLTKLKDKVCWITGASSGIGEALAYDFAKVGAKLVLSGTDEQRLSDVRDKCIAKYKLKSEHVLCLAFDLTELAVHGDKLSCVLNHFGRLDVLVNNAGRSQRADFHDTSINVDYELFRINVFSTINLSRAVLNYWYAKGVSGHFLVTSSTVGKFAAQNGSTYAATKHALHGYFESIRNEAFDRGIRVTMALPGPTFSKAAERAFTGQPGKLFGAQHSDKMRRMTAARCARLMMVALVNDIDEAWIAIQPILTVYYAVQYMPSVTRWLIPKFLSKDKLARMREGN